MGAAQKSAKPIIAPKTVHVEVITPNDTPCGPSRVLRSSDTGGLTNFGAFAVILPPGSRSSLCHGHREVDEFVHMLCGEVAVCESGLATMLRPEAVCFKAGVPAGHYLKNEATAESSYREVGTRLPAEVLSDPDHDRVCHVHGTRGEERFTTLDGRDGVGSPYMLSGA
ncbi:MAG: cupin [Rhodobacterales bacterium]|nr:cupin [Rhodobacterales bacterium]